MDYQKRSNMINQIQKLGEFVLKGELKVLDNESYRITFSISQKVEDMFIFAIDDKKSSKTIMPEFSDMALASSKAPPSGVSGGGQQGRFGGGKTIRYNVPARTTVIATIIATANRGEIP